MPFLHRYLGNPVLSFLGRFFFKMKNGDFHCGLRGFDRKRILELHCNTTGMEFGLFRLGDPASQLYIGSIGDQRGMEDWQLTI